MFFWNKTKPNKKKIINEEISSLELGTELEAIQEEPIIKSTNTFAALAPESVSIYDSGCSYPLDIKNQFPLWSIYKTSPNEPDLSDLVQSYYNWLTCGTKSDISPNFGFFELEKLKQVDILPKDLLYLYSELFIPSLPKDALDGDVSEQELYEVRQRQTLNQIKTPTPTKLDQLPDPKKHQYVSFVKSGVRIVACACKVST